ncbi:MAG: response regulator [Deltaproteobacteria bacterium]|nr:response regulator [Deltaproteobacteria bacterium]MDQ3301451.1 response regulator [Myxococcota bacterium]
MSSPSERDLHRLFDGSPIGMYRSTDAGRFVFANPALARLLGYDDVAELLAVDIARDIYLDGTERPRLIAEYRTKGVIEGVRARWRTRDGRPLTVQIYGHVVEDAAGMSSFDATVVDITASEAQNAQLRHQREELERTALTLDLVVKQVPATYWLVDRDLRIIVTGGAIAQVLGYEPDRWLGSTLYEAMAPDPSNRDPIETHLRALAGETLTYLAEYRDKQLQNTVAPHRRDGEIVGAIGTAIDVTALRMLERRMVDAQRAESLGVLAGGLAHDFNNLLVAILGNADLGLRETPAGSPGHAALENVRHASLRAAELTDQLLAYAGRGGVSSTRVITRPLVDELLRISAPTMPANVRVTVDIAPELATRGDAAQVRQVFLNLIANARDAIGPRAGAIAISARLVQHDGLADDADVVPAGGAGTYVLVEVVDNGPGIDCQTRRRIFEPFFTTKATGHGLGLAAVLGIVRAHGGGLRLSSVPGEGARFSVLWPAAMTPVEMPVVQPVATRKTVLVIDDEKLVRDVLARMIQDLGYTTLTAGDGATGVELAIREAVDIILVDMTMPQMSGAEVIVAVRARKPGIPIVLCSGYDRDGRGSVEADAYLPKPFRIEALEQTLAKLLVRPS